MVNCCLLVCNEKGRSGLLSSLVCIIVQSGTVSVQPHPWFGLVVFLALICYPPVPSSGWGGRVTLSVCLRGLFSAPNWRITAPVSATGLTITLNLFTHPCIPTPFFPVKFKIQPKNTLGSACLCVKFCLKYIQLQSDLTFFSDHNVFSKVHIQFISS